VSLILNSSCPKELPNRPGVGTLIITSSIRHDWFEGEAFSTKFHPSNIAIYLDVLEYYYGSTDDVLRSTRCITHHSPFDHRPSKKLQDDDIEVDTRRQHIVMFGVSQDRRSEIACFANGMKPTISLHYSHIVSFCCLRESSWFLLQSSSDKQQS
jgi:hypothetical protein